MSEQKKRGRQPNREPNKVFTDKKIRDNNDGTATYLKQWNDENGIRQSEEVTRECGKRGHKKRNSEPNKVFTNPKQIRETDGSLTCVFDFNDNQGVRHQEAINLSVVKGKVKPKVVEFPVEETEETEEAEA